jgi:hypothetical protein
VVFPPQFRRVPRRDGSVGYELGHELLDAFIEFTAGRARPNTVRVYAHDLSLGKHMRGSRCSHRRMRR